MQASTILVAVILLAPLVAALAPPARVAAAGQQAEDQDVHPQVRVAILTNVPLGLPTVGGSPRIGFVVVETRDVAALRALFGDRVVPNAAAWADAVPDDPLWSSQWGPQALDMSAAWDVENGSTTVKVAVCLARVWILRHSSVERRLTAGLSAKAQVTVRRWLSKIAADLQQDGEFRA